MLNLSIAFRAIDKQETRNTTKEYIILMLLNVSLTLVLLALVCLMAAFLYYVIVGLIEIFESIALKLNKYFTSRKLRS